jgi:hypothetical protein
VLGEGYADGSAGSGSSGGGYFPGGFPGGGLPNGLGGGTGPGPSGGPSGLGNVIVANRLPLALLFFTLEALILGAAAAWVWARNAPSTDVPDEVLAP